MNLDRGTWCRLMLRRAAERNPSLEDEYRAMSTSVARSWSEEYENVLDDERWQEEFALMRLTGDVP